MTRQIKNRETILAAKNKARTEVARMPRRHSVQRSVETPTLAGLPRPRKPERPPVSRYAIQAIRDLRQLRPPIDFEPGAEATLLETAHLTRAACLIWLRIAKQFYGGPISAPQPSRNPPPVSFLNLLIDWINLYAGMNRRREKAPGWRWRALRGFVDRHRPLQTAQFIRDISRLTKSIAAHFSKSPFEHPLLALWETWHRLHSQREGFDFRAPNGTDREDEAVRVFDVLKRIANEGKVVPSDYSTVEPYLSTRFRECLIKAPHDDGERKPVDELIACAGAMDVYIQYRRLVDKIASDRDYVSDVTTWILKLGEPEAQARFGAIHWRFCGFAPFNFELRRKKSVVRSASSRVR